MTFGTLVHPRYARRARPLQLGVAPLFDELRRGLAADPGARRTDAWSPRIVGRESEKDYRLIAELPGFSEGDFELVVEDGVLTLSGDRPDHFAEPEPAAGEAAAEVGSEPAADRVHFERSFRFREEIDEDAVRARFKNGLLDVTVPKVLPEAPPVRRIPVTSH